jgi:thiopeptide-type bacteriocin biosynthesis protein
MAARAQRAALYEPLDWAVLRAPLLAAGDARHAEPPPDADSLMPADPRIHAAIAVASRDLADALRTTRPCDDAGARKRMKLRRYLIRMSTRATPFGLFAGVGMIEWTSGASNVNLAAGPLLTRTRPDMAWLLEFVAALEADRGIRRHLPLVASSTITLRGDRVFTAATSTQTEVSVRASAVVRQVLAAAEQPTAFGELVSIAGSAPGATPRKATGLVEHLWQQGFLRSILRPPLTAGDATTYVRERLDTLPGASAWTNGLDGLRAELDRCDGSDPAGRVEALTAVQERMAALHPISPNANIIQTDLRLPMAGTRLNHQVASEAAEAARLLLLLNPHSAQSTPLDGYRGAFVAKYGHDRQVPLLDVLNPDVGLGPIADRRVQQPTFWTGPMLKQQLLDLALEANRDRQLVVELTDRQIDDLAMPPVPADDYQPSIEICIAVAAASTDALDRGQFQIVVGPNVGAPAAGRHLGRFADLLGRAAADALGSVAEYEQQRLPATLAEVVYTPDRARSANVAIRPAVRSHEIVVDTQAGVPGDYAVPVNELLVGVRAGRFVLSWPRGDTEIIAVQGHMLNTLAAPPAVQFLLAVGAQRQTSLTAFSWGPAANFAFLPRVQRGRIVLAPAQWRLFPGILPASADAETFGAAVSEWRTRWHVPRNIYLGAHGDNRLLLDLDAADQVELLRDELAKGAGGRTVLVQEGLPGPEHAWLPGPTGGHICELVVPLRRRHPGQPPADGTERPKVDVQPATARLRPPGSEWLYLKLYSPEWRHDEIIADTLRTFADFATRAALSDGWFFIRYADPDSHLRIRFHGNAATLLGPLMAQVCEWAGELIDDDVCSKFSVDTYEREVERYGGHQLMDLAESIFMADSPYVAEALHAVSENRISIDPLTLAIVSTDDLLGSLGLTTKARTAFYRAATPTTRPGGSEYRLRKTDLRELLGCGPNVELARLLSMRSAALAGVAEGLAAQLQHDLTGNLGNDLYRSYIHMHINRILGTGREDEQLVLEQLRRTRDGLEQTRPHPTAGVRSCR